MKNKTLTDTHELPPVMDTAGFRRLKVTARRYHFHSPLLIYVITTVVLVFGAINGQNNLLFWLFGLAVGGLIVSGFVSGAVLMAIELERDVPTRATVGDSVRVRYRIRSGHAFIPASALFIEELSEERKGVRATWPRALSRGVTFVSRVAPRSSQVAVAEVAAVSRGVVTFEHVRTSTTFPFGLTKKSVIFSGSQRILIRPRAATVSIRQLLGGAGQFHDKMTDHRGHQGEFHSLRDYVDGDPMRSLDWKATARLGRPVVRELSQPRSPTVVIVLWTHASDPGVEQVVEVAAGLAVDAEREGLFFSVVDSSGRLLVPSGAGRSHVASVLDRLAEFVPQHGGFKPSGLDVHSSIIVVHAGAHRTINADASIDAREHSRAGTKAAGVQTSHEVEGMFDSLIRKVLPRPANGVLNVPSGSREK